MDSVVRIGSALFSFSNGDGQPIQLQGLSMEDAMEMVS